MPSIPLPSGDRLATIRTEDGHVLLAATSAGASGEAGHASGDEDASIDIPVGARVRLMTVTAGSEGGSITIKGMDPIVMPADAEFEDAYPVVGTGDADIVLEGVVLYYVSWGG